MVGRPAEIHQFGVISQTGFCHRSISSYACRKAEEIETCMDLLSAFINIQYQYKAVLGTFRTKLTLEIDELHTPKGGLSNQTI